MVALNFPASPTNGQTYTLNGVVYQYSTAIGGWTTSYQANPFSTFVSDTQVYYGIGGNANGSYGLTFVAASNAVYANAITVRSSSTFAGNVNMSTANFDSITLSDTSGTISWDTSQAAIAYVTLTAAGRTMAAPTNLKVGTYILHVLQDATGSRTITSWNAVFKWPGAQAPVLSTAASRRDIISFVCDGTNLYGTYVNDVR